MRRRLGFVGEIAAMFALACLLGWLFNDGQWSFPGVALHPFLLIVGIEAVSYGLRPALLASAIGLTLYIIGARGLSTADSLPMLAIMATGIMLGLAQESRSRQLREARGELDRARADGERLKSRIAVLDQANRELSERILGEVNTVSSFSEIARRLSVLDRKDLFPAICELVNDYLSATRSTVYTLAGTQLELRASSGYSLLPDELKTLTDAESLAWVAVREKAPMSALDLLSRQPTGKLARAGERQHSKSGEGARQPGQSDGRSGEPGRVREGEFPILLAAPIIEESTGLVTGVICVNNLPFAKFHGASKKILGVIARWAGDALHNAAIVESLRQQAAEK